MKVKPLLVILSPRDIPWLEEQTNKIDYVDKLWIKYYTEEEADKIATEYFLNHPEYTHIIINADDAKQEYNHIAMLVADYKKYGFPIITGCCCQNKINNRDLHLNLTLNQVISSLNDKPVYLHLSNEMRFLNGIIRVWFQGNATPLIERDIFIKLGGLKPITKWQTDLRFSYMAWKEKIPQFVDLRCYMEHFRYPLSHGKYRLLVGEKKPYVKLIKATKKKIPNALPAKIIYPDDEIRELSFIYLLRDLFRNYKYLSRVRVPQKPYPKCKVADPNLKGNLISEEEWFGHYWWVYILYSKRMREKIGIHDGGKLPYYFEIYEEFLKDKKSLEKFKKMSERFCFADPKSYFRKK